VNTIRTAVVAIAGLSVLACAPPEQAETPSAVSTASLAPIRVSGSYWIELSPVLVAANRFYAEQLQVGEGGIVRITSGETDLATNAETQLLRESLTNPDLRIIMTVTESFYRLVARRSAGIETLADLEGKRVMLPRNTSANYYLVAMLRTVGLTEDDLELLPLPPVQGDQTGMDQMSDALARGDVDAISIWEPEPEDAIRRLATMRYFRTAACIARSSTCMPERRIWPIRTSAARSWRSCAPSPTQRRR
jgi:NitT/TauT family transport system substrate-binding protein